MNPARDLGPRIITHLAGWGAANLSYGWWAYSAGPMIGGILGGALYNGLYIPKKQDIEIQKKVESQL